LNALLDFMVWRRHWAAYPAAPPMGSIRSAVRSQSHFAVLYARKTHLVVAFCHDFGSLVSIAMSDKINANPGSHRIWYLLAT